MDTRRSIAPDDPPSVNPDVIDLPERKRKDDPDRATVFKPHA